MPLLNSENLEDVNLCNKTLYSVQKTAGDNQEVINFIEDYIGFAKDHI